MFETACHGGVIGRLDTAWRVLGLSQVFIYIYVMHLILMYITLIKIYDQFIL